MRELRALEAHEPLDVQKAYRLCEKYPSVAARVTKAMLLRIGRPQGEIERAVSETENREAAQLYRSVRTLNLAAAVTPLIGLLGTVWGMIGAFFVTANLPPGANKAQMLAGGIYVALVTTVGGLAVAIPAVMLSHYFEGKIQARFHELQELLSRLLLRIESYEGQVRLDEKQLAGENGHVPRPSIVPGNRQNA